MKLPRGKLPKAAEDELRRAASIPDRRARLAAIDKARERAAYNYPHLFKENTTMQVKLKNARLAFPALFEAKSVNGEGEPAFSASFILGKDHPQIAEIRAAIEAVARDKWGAKAKEHLQLLNKTGKLALKDGDDKAQYDGFADNLYITSRNKTRPMVIDRDKSPLVSSDGRPYAGCYVNAIVEFWAQDNKYGKRVNASLGGVQFYEDGDAFAAAGVASADDFDSIGVEGEKAEAGAW